MSFPSLVRIHPALDDAAAGGGAPALRFHDVVAHACKLGLEGIVSKRRDMPYQHGRSRAWLETKNPASAAMQPVWEDRF